MNNFKKLTKYMVLAAGLLAAVPQTAQAGFYAATGSTLDNVDPHFVYTGSLLLGSLMSYMALNTLYQRHCACQKPRDKNCVVEALHWFGDYAKHVCSTALGFVTTAACYKVLAGVDKGVVTTAGLVQKATMQVQTAQTNATTAIHGMPNNTKYGLAALGGAVAVAGSVLLYKKFIAPRGDDAPIAPQFHDDADDDIV